MAVGRRFRQRRPTIAVADLDAEVTRIAAMNIDALRQLWRERRGTSPPSSFTKDLLARALSFQLQEDCLGSLDPRLRRLLSQLATSSDRPVQRLKVGSVLVREYRREVHQVMVIPDGFCWRGVTYASLSTIARKITGTSWNGPRFFGLRGVGLKKDASDTSLSRASEHAALKPSAQKLVAGARARHAALADYARRSRHEGGWRDQARRCDAAALRDLHPQVDRA